MKPLLAGITAGVLTVLAGASVVAEEQPADVCLEVAPEAVSADEWEAVGVAVSATVAGPRGVDSTAR